MSESAKTAKARKKCEDGGGDYIKTPNNTYTCAVKCTAATPHRRWNSSKRKFECRSTETSTRIHASRARPRAKSSKKKTYVDPYFVVKKTRADPNETYFTPGWEKRIPAKFRNEPYLAAHFPPWLSDSEIRQVSRRLNGKNDPNETESE